MDSLIYSKYAGIKKIHRYNNTVDYDVEKYAKFIYFILNSREKFEPRTS